MFGKKNNFESMVSQERKSKEGIELKILWTVSKDGVLKLIRNFLESKSNTFAAFRH